MYPEEYEENAVVIREGNPGSTLYVMEGQCFAHQWLYLFHEISPT